MLCCVSCCGVVLMSGAVQVPATYAWCGVVAKLGWWALQRVEIGGVRFFKKNCSLNIYFCGRRRLHLVAVPLCGGVTDWLLPRVGNVAFIWAVLPPPLSPSIRNKAQQKAPKAAHVHKTKTPVKAARAIKPNPPGKRHRASSNFPPSNTHLDGSLELKQNGLLDENLSGLCAKISNLVLHQLDLLAGARASDLEQSVDDGVEINFFLIGHSSSGGDVRACRWPCGGRVLIKSDCTIIRVSFPKPCHGRVSWGGDGVCGREKVCV